MAAVAQSDSIPSDRIVGTDECRSCLWGRIKKLGVRKEVLTKHGAQMAKVYFDSCIDRPSLEGVFDAGVRFWHRGLKYATRRQMAEEAFYEARRRLDERSSLWLADERSWESLAPCPIPWDTIVALRRDGIHNVATLDMLDDKELSNTDGIGTARIQLIRKFCGRALKEQAKANPKPKRVRKPKRPALPAEPALF
ncbi:MAG: hypothetical protein Q7K33_01095 [Candidatus Berkelbacteria bacterium]|nr:hypothetical protein [Candidatus Berkelbacteria bacterium]